MPLFVLITVVDKLLFFLVWGVIQALAIRQLVEPVAIRKVLAVKGGSELVRTVNNSLADAVFFYGVSQLVAGRLATVIAVAGVPFGTHFAVLLLQATAPPPPAGAAPRGSRGSGIPTPHRRRPDHGTQRPVAHLGGTDRRSRRDVLLRRECAAAAAHDGRQGSGAMGARLQQV